jgi:hypothetical protein
MQGEVCMVEELSHVKQLSRNHVCKIGLTGDDIIPRVYPVFAEELPWELICRLCRIYLAHLNTMVHWVQILAQQHFTENVQGLRALFHSLQANLHKCPTS